MKKAVFISVSLLFLLAILFRIFLYPKLEIISGYNAKILCSCVFVSGLDADKSLKEELGFGPLWLANNEVNYETKEVKTSVFGMHKRHAIFREGLGCTLISNNIKSYPGSLAVNKDKFDYSSEIWQMNPVSGSPRLQEVLREAFDIEGATEKKTRAVVVVKDGEIVGEAYAPEVNQNTPLLGWSMTKSITSCLAGILENRAYWDLDTPLPVNGWQDDGRNKITLRNTLHMSTGLQWEEEYGEVSTATIMLYGSANMGSFAASLPLEHEPGAYFEYSSGTTNILAQNIAKAFPDHQSYLDFPYEALFAPLGAKSFFMETDDAGYFVGSSYGYASARDWAKVGLLYLNKGNWLGKQIIDTSWVDFSHAEAPASKGIYGAHFWINRGGTFKNYSPNAYWMDGFQGQQVSIHPEENMVIVRLGVTYKDADFDFDSWTAKVIEAARELK